MKQKIITTNIRIPEHDLIQVKVIAAERGISVNTYIKEVLSEATTRAMFPKSKSTGKKARKKYSIWDLPKLAQGLPRKPMGWSEEDKAIYEV